MRVVLWVEGGGGDLKGYVWSYASCCPLTTEGRWRQLSSIVALNGSTADVGDEEAGGDLCALSYNLLTQLVATLKGEHTCMVPPFGITFVHVWIDMNRALLLF